MTMLPGYSIVSGQRLQTESSPTEPTGEGPHGKFHHQGVHPSGLQELVLKGIQIVTNLQCNSLDPFHVVAIHE